MRPMHHLNSSTLQFQTRETTQRCGKQAALCMIKCLQQPLPTTTWAGCHLLYLSTHGPHAQAEDALKHNLLSW
jgi:hypothetical protein